MNELSQLSVLPHLVELELDGINIDPTAEATNPLTSVKALGLSNIALSGGNSVDIPFCRILSNMFPSLHKLDVQFFQKVKYKTA